MKPNTPAPGLLARAVPFSPKLELHLGPVCDTRSGALTGLDCRLYRRVETTEPEGALVPSQAGFRVPLAAVRPLARALHELADALGLP